MKDRITQFLASEGISPAEFADKIGVQRSSVSHVLNGRNYPSATFIQKMLGSYKTINPRWLLLGEGSISETKSAPIREPSLFQFPAETELPKTSKESVKTDVSSAKEITSQLSDSVANKQQSPAISNQGAELNLAQSLSDLGTSLADNKEVERIVLFYKDKTFAAYTPSK